MYSNLGTKKIKNKVNENTVTMIAKRINLFETNMMANHTEIINNVCPKSGWDKSKIIIGTKIAELKRYFR